MEPAGGVAPLPLQQPDLEFHFGLPGTVILSWRVVV